MQRINIGVIPVGGKGNRIEELPFTRILPKPMFPILNRPILEYVIQNMKKLNVKDVYFILGHKGYMIKQYFKDGSDFGIKAHYIKDDALSGLANAITLVEPFIKEPFLTILGDDLTLGASWKKLSKIFFSNKCVVVEGVVKENEANSIKRTCEVHLGPNKKILDIIEKPKTITSYLRGCGIYVFSPEIFKFIHRTKINGQTGKKELTDSIRNVAGAGLAYGWMLEGENININTLPDLIKANQLILKYQK